MYAALGGHLDICKELVSHGANLNAKTKLGYTPLSQAEVRGHKEVAAFLKEASKK